MSDIMCPHCGMPPPSVFGCAADACPRDALIAVMRAPQKFAADNVIPLRVNDGRWEEWHFPDGTVVTMLVSLDEPPITAKHAVYCLSEVIHRIHRAMEGK